MVPELELVCQPFDFTDEFVNVVSCFVKGQPIPGLMPVLLCLTEHAKALAEHGHKRVPVSRDSDIIVPITGIAFKAETEFCCPFGRRDLGVIHVI